MRFINLFRHGETAPIARDRLKILLSHERALHAQSDLLTILQNELLTLITRAPRKIPLVKSLRI